MRRIMSFLLVIMFAVPGLAGAEIVQQDVGYEHDGVRLLGHLVYDSALEAPLPGVVVVHEWWGLNHHAKNSARRLAEMGYAAFAVDMYGRDVTTDSYEKAAELSKPFREDRTLMRERALAGLKAFIDMGLVQPDNIAAMGYCFGGTVSLEMARAGQPLKGVVSFHGNLGTPMPGESFKSPILVLHGAADPLVSDEEIAAFKQEMRNADADWQMVYFGGAVHSFTNPGAGTDPEAASAYDPDAANRSWEYMRLFFQEMLDR